ncbi:MULTISPECIES: LysE family transporter [unclassified Leptolyngbya]|uniref:LysE/ArgO family amino acid transporter n=1 Tax=unclassified Leptolyngbya TaxID=2650499 RepID=UPI001683F92A|nr:MULTISPECIES: LysE family transporter [unclassified Leptolyngbya]MBD1914120.1 LysE family transporter [Leptolyngbya sp. FACHB-8]MBD2158727.1 LysE family transporter [Leptolyngbya sp. FACHB-16]
MDTNFFLRGFVIGFSIAVPVGPIGLLCIQRTLARGQIAGLLSGLGAATADAIYGAIAAFGLTIISAILMQQVFWFRLVGGIFLIYLGVCTFRSKPAEQAVSAQGDTLWRVYGSTLVLTLTNPATILSFVAVFAGLGLATAAGDRTTALVLVFGVFLGSALWWLLLSSGVSLFKTRLTARHLQWLNRGSGIIITAFGIVALLSSAWGS